MQWRFILCLAAPFLSLMPQPATATSIHAGSHTRLYPIPAEAVWGAVDTTYISDTQAVDAPKNSGINATAFDWWYFDVGGSDLNSSIVITFNLGLETGLTGGGASVVPFVTVYGSFANGSSYFYQQSAGEGALVTTGADQQSTGVWAGTGARWVATRDLKSYVVSFDTPTLSGTVTLLSRADAHYPCGPIEPGSNLLVAPYVGWANAVPDATGLVNLRINGEKVQYAGVGYHDKNWGNQPYSSTYKVWYWGHAHLGPYSVVWFQVLDNHGNLSHSAYVSKAGKILVASCSADAITVRPVGTPFPPTSESEWPLAYTITISLGADKGHLELTATGHSAILQAPIYRRWLGTVEGSINGGPVLTGYGIWEDANILRAL